MKSAGNRFPAYWVLLLPIVLLPCGALAGQARASMQVSVQVVRGDYSRAAAVVVAAAEARESASAVINPADECKAMGNMIILDGAWATCNWDPDSHVYLVTVQY